MINPKLGEAEDEGFTQFFVIIDLFTNACFVKKAIWKLINLLLYSNVWIALAAVAMILQTSLVYTGEFVINQLYLFIFSSTLFVYATHRLVALKKLESNQWQERFFYISKVQRWIYIYAAVAALVSLVLFIKLSSPLQWAILAPGLLSLAYVFPVLKGNRRIRDIHYLKIFLIAIVWAWVTVIIPAIQMDIPINHSVYLMSFERTCFIFAITLPFDIRDLLLDQQQAVKTLPGVIGSKAARKLAGILLALAFTASLFLWYLDIYSNGQIIALLMSSLIAFGLIYYAHPELPDYYFTGLLDGTMLLQFLLFYLFSGS